MARPQASGLYAGFDQADTADLEVTAGLYFRDEGQIRKWRLSNDTARIGKLVDRFFKWVEAQPDIVSATGEALPVLDRNLVAYLNLLRRNLEALNTMKAGDQLADAGLEQYLALHAKLNRALAAANAGDLEAVRVALSDCRSLSAPAPASVTITTADDAVGTAQNEAGAETTSPARGREDLPPGAMPTEGEI